MANNTKFANNQIRFKLDVSVGLTNITSKIGGDDIQDQVIVPDAIQRASYKISSPGTLKYALSDLTVDIQFLTGTDKRENVNIAESLNDAGWKRRTENSLVSDKNNLE